MEVVDAEIAEVIGFYADYRQQIVDHVKGRWHENFDPDYWLVLCLPCGHEVKYEKLEDIPFESVPCSCGDPRHWFIKYRE